MKATLFLRFRVRFLVVALGTFVSVATEANEAVQVFILAGQSNMEGKAAAYTLDAALKDPLLVETFEHLKQGDQWTVRDDVFVTFLDNTGRGGFPKHGGLTVGFGSEKTVRNEAGVKVPHPGVGPELGIGHVLGDRLDSPVLLIKAAWGGRAVKYSFRPPSAMPEDEALRAEVAEIEARRQAAIERAEKAKAEGRRGKQPPAPRSFEAHKAGYGADYRRILSETQRVLEDIAAYVPNYDPEAGYDLAGFIWFQGWNDGVGAGNPDYTEQMAHFIRDMRRDLGAPELPFVIGELGTDGLEATGWVAAFRQQQSAIATIDEFQGNVKVAETAPYWPSVPDMSAEWASFRILAQANSDRSEDDPLRVDPGEFYRQNWENKYRAQLAYTSDKRYHYLGSGACYYEMGASMGRAMLELLASSPARLP